MPADRQPEAELDNTRFAPEHDAERHRFVVHHAGGDSVLTYQRPRADVIDLQHTVVLPAERGRGTGEALVRAALGFAREQSLRVIPTCPFVAEVLAKHPEAGKGLTMEPVAR